MDFRPKFCSDFVKNKTKKPNRLQAMRTTTQRFAGSALARLFAYYLTGRIAEAQWRQLSRLLDARSTTPEEREAMAAFFSDLLQERGAEVRIPRLKEFRELLATARMAV
jgi:hypothetical protein